MEEYRLDVGTVSYFHITENKTPSQKNCSHCHDKYEILYVKDGNGVAVVEGVRYEIQPQTVIILPPLTYHSVEVSAHNTYERYVVSFTKDDVPAEMHGLLKSFESVKMGEGCFCACRVNALLLSLLDRFKDEISLPKNEKIQYFRLLISQLLVSLAAEKHRVNSERNECELGARIIRYLGECVTKNISLEHLEKYFFVSKYHLCRAFKKYNGISIHGYINHKRVMYAKRLIDAGETAYVAALKVGYGDYSAFYRAFVKIVGKSPTEKRREEHV